MATVREFKPNDGSMDESMPSRHGWWDACEVAIGYSLILSVIWTPRPFQRYLYWTTIAWFLLSLTVSFPGWKELGFRVAGFWRSFWVVAAAAVLATAGVVVAARMHTLHAPGSATEWVRTFLGYTIWSFLQQFLMQGYFLLRIIRILPNGRRAVIATAGIFALAHLPNPILTPMTLLWGFVACSVFLRFRNIYPLAAAHAIFGICIAIAFPGPVVHNMRVGLGYLRYRAPREIHLSQSDQKVSTVAWVMADAPTRRSARQDLP